jgi:hypothetical protein
MKRPFVGFREAQIKNLKGILHHLIDYIAFW